MRGIRSLLGVSIFVAAASGIIPSVADAAPAVPKGEPVMSDYPAGELCTFPVELSVVSGQQGHDTGQGDIIITGPFTAIVTNLATSASEIYNISGPTFVEDGQEVPTAVTGPNLILQPASRNVGPAFLILTTGRVTFTSNFTIASRRGAVTDVCAALS
jgi:hypothetical protein